MNFELEDEGERNEEIKGILRQPDSPLIFRLSRVSWKFIPPSGSFAVRNSVGY